jgi:hypothetical protein
MARGISKEFANIVGFLMVANAGIGRIAMSRASMVVCAVAV